MCLDTKRCVTVFHRELVCSICLGILCIDCLMDENEHVYCKNCILEWLRLGNSKCPIGNEPINHSILRSSRFIKSILSDLHVHCKYEEQGCKMVIKYEYLNNHEDECQFNIITCECGVTIKKIDKLNHLCPLEEPKKVDKKNIPQPNNHEPIKREWKFDNSPLSIQNFKKDYDALFLNNNKVTYDKMDTKSKLIILETCSSTFFEFEAIKSTKSLHVPSKSLFTMSFLKSKRKIVISDYMDKALKIIDLNGVFQSRVSHIGFLDKPWAVCSNSRNDLFISDWEKKGIIILDNNLKPISTIGDKYISNACYMNIDPDNEAILYITHYIDNKISIWNVDENKLINTITIDSPEYIQVKKHKIYVTSRTDIEYFEGKKEFKRVKDGSNCIFIIDKSNYSVINGIRINEWLDPKGLYVDENLNIITTAFKLDNDNNRSDSRFLFIMNERKKCYTTIYLNGINVLSDMLFIENKVYFCISDLIEILTLK